MFSQVSVVEPKACCDHVYAHTKAVVYTIGQKLSDLFLHVSNFEIDLLGLLQKIGIL